MILKVSDFLRELITAEAKKLEKSGIKHRPTIGKMYEGLTSNIIDRAIPPSLGLQLVGGVITDGEGGMTGEIDLMLVCGEGEKIPYTDLYKWHVKNVIAVFEIKKNLYAKDLKDSFVHVRKVQDIFSNYLQSKNSSETVDLNPAKKAFSQTTQKSPPEYEKVDQLPIEDQIIFHTMVMESLVPLRIVFGYRGFKTEFNFRKCMIEYLGKNLNKKGFGPGSFPNLIVCGDFSLVKANGQPYSAQIQESKWPFFLSSSDNPLIFLLELIWTRLVSKYRIDGLFGEDLQIEVMKPLILAEPKRTTRVPSGIGWEYTYLPISRNELKQYEKESERQWSPCFLNQAQFVLIHKLCMGHNVSIDDPELIEYVKKEGHNFQDFIKSTLKTGLIALDEKQIVLITEECQCVILPTGDYVAADNVNGRLSRWLAQNN